MRFGSRRARYWRIVKVCSDEPERKQRRLKIHKQIEVLTRHDCLAPSERAVRVPGRRCDLVEGCGIESAQCDGWKVEWMESGGRCSDCKSSRLPQWIRHYSLLAPEIGSIAKADSQRKGKHRISFSPPLVRTASEARRYDSCLITTNEGSYDFVCAGKRGHGDSCQCLTQNVVGIDALFLRER